MKLSVKDMAMRCAAGFLLLVLAVQVVRAVTKEAAVAKLRWDNAVTRTILYDMPDMFEKNDEIHFREIDWAEKYPFPADAKLVEETQARPDGAKKKSKFQKKKETITEWGQNKLPGYFTAIEWKNQYDKLLGRDGDFVIQGIRPFRGKYLISSVKRASSEEIGARVRQTAALSEFCEARGIPFLYVQAPAKAGREDERAHRAEWKSYVNDNADDFLKGLRERNVDVLDLRDVIEAEGLDNAGLFFYTDPHWKPETALWSAGVLAETLSTKPEWHYAYDPRLLAPESYDGKVYEKIFLGSQGRKVTLAFSEPDDITLLYPKGESHFTFEIPSLSLKKTGDYSVGYNMAHVQRGNFYRKVAYAAHIYGGNDYTRITNHDHPDGRRFLLIKDSFGEPAAMPLAMTLSTLEVIDMRAFTGSLRTFIEKDRPEGVIVLYNPGEIAAAPIDWNTHRDIFDFR